MYHHIIKTFRKEYSQIIISGFVFLLLVELALFHAQVTFKYGEMKKAAKLKVRYI